MTSLFTTSDPGVLEHRGIENIRSDSTQFLVESMNICLELLFIEKDSSKAVKFLEDQLSRLGAGEVPIEDLVITKRVTKLDYKAKQLHLAAHSREQRRRELDGRPTEKVYEGLKIGFLVIQPSPMRPRAAINERTEVFEYVKNKKVAVDVKFYSEKQLLKPIDRLMRHAVDPIIMDELFESVGLKAPKRQDNGNSAEVVSECESEDGYE